MAEKIKVPAGVYDMVTRCMEQEFPDHVAIRYVAEDGKTVVEKKYLEYKYYLLQSGKEIAAALNMSVESVNTRLSRGRDRLRRQLTEKGVYTHA